MKKQGINRILSYYWFVAFFFMLIPVARSQAQNTKSPDTVIVKTVEKILQVGKNAPDPDSSIKCFKKALQVSKDANYPYGVANGLMGIGLKNFEKGRLDTGLAYIKQAYPFCQRSADKGALGLYYSNIALYYSSTGDYVAGAANFYNALEEFKKIYKTPNINIAVVYLNLARVNSILQQDNKAFGYLTEGLAIARKGNFLVEQVAALNNLGNWYMRNHKPDSAKQQFIEAIDIDRKNHFLYAQASAELNLAGIYFEEGQKQRAIDLLTDAATLTKDLPRVDIEVSYALGEVWTTEKKYKDAEHILLSAIEKAKKIRMKDLLIKGNTKLLDLYKASGDYKKAVAIQDTISILKDSLLSADKAKSINQMEIKYKTAEKDKEIISDRLMIEQQKNKLTRRNLWTTGVISGIMLLTLIFAGLYRRGRHRQYVLTQQVKSLQQENKIEVLKAIMSGEEGERKRLARELHDGIGGMVSSAMMQYIALRQNNTGLMEGHAYDDIMSLLNEIGEEVRKTAHNLMPEVLLKQPLQEAIRSYCNYVQKNSSFKINFHCHGIFDNVSESLKLNVYRIVQELLKNISVHAHATTVLVQLHMHDQLLTITVEDNGVGFNVSGQKNGMGLDNIQARVHSHDGKYSIASEPGKGTSVFIEFDQSQATSNRAI